MIGKGIDNYKFIKLLGQGSFGAVYLSKNTISNKEFAIKVIPVRVFDKNPKLGKSISNQIQALTKLKDTTHIVETIELLKTVNHFYFVYEFCNGGTLGKKIRTQGKLQEHQALIYFKQLLEAFKVLHKNNIIHRDVKPQNILIHNGVLKLGDFGVCKTLNNPEELSFQMMGSPLYMAPEVLKAGANTRKADIWSLGVVLHQMLFGRCPFESTNLYGLLMSFDKNDIIIDIPEHSISSECADILRKMLEKNQFKRIGWEQLFGLNISEGGIFYPSIKISYVGLEAPSQNLTKSYMGDRKQEIKNKSADVSRMRNSQQNSQDDRFDLKSRVNRVKIHEEYQKCLKAMQIADNFIKEMQSRGLPMAYIIFKEIQSRIEKFPKECFIGVSNQLSKVRQNLKDISERLTSYDKQLIKTPKKLFKSRFMGDFDSELVLWAQMVIFLKNSSQDPTTRKSMSSLVHQYITS